MSGYTEEDEDLIAPHLEYGAKAVLGALAVAGRLIPPGWRPDREWAVRRDDWRRPPGFWTSEPFYRREHAERLLSLPGDFVVTRRLVAEHWQRADG